MMVQRLRGSRDYCYVAIDGSTRLWPYDLWRLKEDAKQAVHDQQKLWEYKGVYAHGDDAAVAARVADNYSGWFPR